MGSKEKHREYNLKYYHNKRADLIDRLGGKCSVCGSAEDLQFDHMDSSLKEFAISSNLQRSSQYLAGELDKCQLLCKKCHINKSKTCRDTSVSIDADTANKICIEYLSTEITQHDLGVKYNLSQSEVGRIIRGERWGAETKSIDKSLLARRTKDKGCIMPETSVDMIDPETDVVIKSYSSIAAASRDGHTPSSISRCCSGKSKTHHGFIWKKHK